MNCQWRLFFPFPLMICNLLLVALMGTGCLATMVYDKYESKEGRLSNEFSDEVKKRDNVFVPGEYLGIDDYWGMQVYHYQFPGLLQGEDRYMHIMLSIKDECAFAEECKRIKRDDTRPAWLIFHATRDKPEYRDALTTFALPEKQDYIPCVAITCLERGYFSAWNAFDEETGKKWGGVSAASWKIRSPLRYAGDQFLVTSAAVACIPVDVALVVLAPIWIPPVLYLIGESYRW